MPAAIIDGIELHRYKSITNGFDLDVIDAATGDVTRQSNVNQAYISEAFRAWLPDCGFTNLRCSPSLIRNPDDPCADLFGILSRKVWT